jgi:hypothetical protein
VLKIEITLVILPGLVQDRAEQEKRIRNSKPRSNLHLQAIDNREEKRILNHQLLDRVFPGDMRYSRALS